MIGIGIGIGIGRQRFSGGFDADYQAVLDYATTQGYSLPSEGYQTLQNNLIVSLKDEGIWGLIDHLQVYPNDASGNDFATINWINPDMGHNAIQVNGPILSKHYGFTNDGATEYVNTNVNLATDSNNFEHLNNMISVGFRQESNQLKTVNFGARTDVFSKTQIAGIAWAGVLRYFGNIDDFTQFDAGYLNNNNIQAKFVDGTAYRFRDGNLIDTVVLSTYGDVPNYDFYILALNNGGSPQFNGGRGYVDHFMSGSGDINVSAFNTLIANYKTEILSL